MALSVQVRLPVVSFPRFREDGAACPSSAQWTSALRQHLPRPSSSSSPASGAARSLSAADSLCQWPYVAPTEASRPDLH